ncbi:Fe-S cluster assembly protein HesB [Pedobacter lusitanus]|uniref:DNA-3-methyladenine glycosylase II n=1 Tax=Pedobacter lusitanus TaxID=1503925 RepID=A0A0D0GSI3_9SPHI|nr:DNA-3-methyladenine glycosylase [Pedobacter lusitanus]KIO77346.1 Fe-S cluster assembly protein HesB [Pedobacter lusitanus]
MNVIVNEKDINLLIEADPVIAGIYSRLQSPPNWSRPAGFVTLSKIILEQQVSLSSAHAHFLKLNAYIKEFTPVNILKLSDDEMRNCQISRQKAKYLRELSNAILHQEINLEELHNLDETEIRKQLTAIKGIGHWTADVYLMFCLGAKDILPLGDIAVVNTIKELTGAATKEEMLVLAEKWKPLRSLATYFLWHHYLIKRKRNSSTLGYTGTV